ncbi:MAG: calcium/sodium antiporter [Paracoccaceae bacterium]
MDLAVAAAGLAILLGAGDALVRGAVALSLRLGVPALIVSLTIVAFGTSAPELLIAVKGALADADGIVYGNVVGSNIANVLLVLGAPALISRLDARESDCFGDYLLMLGVSVLFIALCFWGPLSRPQGLLLLAILGYVLWDAWRSAQAHRRAGAAEAELAEGVDPSDAGTPGWRIALFLAAGLIGLPLGASMLIDGARGLAEAFGVSEAAIGLTLVAVGTSLPELATTVAAALRRHADVAIGNVIGSNLFNIVAVMGVASLVSPLTAPDRFLTVDLWVMLACSALLFPFVRGLAVMGRGVGVAFLALYLVYVASAFAPSL